MNRIFKLLLGIVATIFLGAVGSGLWERFLGPALDWLTRSTVGLFASAIGSYRDSIYESAARGFHEAQALALYSIFILMLPLIYLLLLRQHPTLRRSTPSDPTRAFVRSPRGFWLLAAITFAVTIGAFFATLRLRHINETITYTLGSFEIVRPYVGESKYAEFRSRYYAMRTATEFQVLFSEVAAAAKQHNLRLPAYEPL